MAITRVFKHDVHSFLNAVLLRFFIGQNVLNIDITAPVPVVKQSPVDLKNLEVALFFPYYRDLNCADCWLYSFAVCIYLVCLYYLRLLFLLDI